MEAIAKQIDALYYADGLGCAYCLHRKRKTKAHNLPCREDDCRYEGIRLDAITHGRLVRPQGVLNLPG